MVFDKAFINGKIYTMDQDGTRAEAMLVHGGRILAVGSSEEISTYPVRERIDLEGYPVIPGLIDTHCHVPEMVDNSRKVDLSGARSIQDVVDLMKRGLETLKPGKWLLGRGLSSNLLAEQRLPNRYDLDRVSTSVPIYVMAFDGHSSMGNGKLLETAGIGKGYSPSEGELLEFDGEGVPTGIFKETPINMRILKSCPPLYASDKEAKEAIRKCLLASAKQGYTTLHTMLRVWPSMLSPMRLYQEMAREGALPVRLNLCYCDCYENNMEIISGLGDEWVRLSACKFFIDGAISERTAYLSQEYQDQPGWRGCMVLNQDMFCQRVEQAYRLGNDVGIHIIGDAALDVILDLIERIQNPSSRAHFELIHCAVTRPDQLVRMKALPVIVHKQPIFIAAPTTLHGEDKLGELNRWYHSLRSYLDAGICVTGGTDGPLSDTNPFTAIECAVTRKSFDGETVVNSEERISVEEAVRMFTASAARAGHEEAYKGTLEAGKGAGFLPLGRDNFHMESHENHQNHGVQTYVGGLSPNTQNENTPRLVH